MRMHFMIDVCAMISIRKKNGLKNVAKLINEEFYRLEIGLDANPYSGLCADLTNIVDRQDILDVKPVKIYDDSDSGVYDGVKLLKYLRQSNLGDVTLNNDTTNVWQQIAQFSAE
jgi:hypothetical protein